MASRLSPLGIFVKWLLVPAGLAALGYFIVGPRVGDQVLPDGAKQKIHDAAGQPRPTPNNDLDIPDGEALPDEDKPTKNYKAPEVDVTVQPIGNYNKERSRPRRNTTRKKPPTSRPSAPSAPSSPDTPPTSPGDGDTPPATGGTDG